MADFSVKYKRVRIDVTNSAANPYTTPISRIGESFPTMDAVQACIDRRLTEEFQAHRPPTTGESNFGHGATHYRTFTIADFWDHQRQRLKSKCKADDGLVYSRR